MTHDYKDLTVRTRIRMKDLIEGRYTRGICINIRDNVNTYLLEYRSITDPTWITDNKCVIGFNNLINAIRTNDWNTLNN